MQAPPLRHIVIGAVALLGVIQIVPYGRAHDNPPAGPEPTWDSPQTRALVKRACFDCHSHETVWPWYSNVAPVSWLVQSDVEEGRHHLDFQQWDRPQRHAHDAAEEVREGDMPLPIYLLMHPEARLSDAERSALEAGLSKTLGEGGEHDPSGSADHHDEDDD
jgi:hypothetical protein